MNVTLIAYTQFTMPSITVDTPFGNRVRDNWLNGDVVDAPADTVAEFAGRLCYDSFHLPNEATATSEGYLANIIKQQHFSVLEHASASFLITGVSRSLLMEMRTHRHASFSARSTRYVDESSAKFVIPPAVRDYVDLAADSDSTWTLHKELDSVMEHAREVYGMVAELAYSNGATRKEAREAAREFLPGATVTEFVMTANHHAWRDILRKRTAPGAAKEIQLVANEILRQLKILAPNTYQDMEPSK